MHRPHLRWCDYDNDGNILPDGFKRLKDGTIVITDETTKLETIFVVTVREEIDGEDVVYHKYFSSEEKAETFINKNLKGQTVMSLSEEEVE